MFCLFLNVWFNFESVQCTVQCTLYSNFKFSVLTWLLGSILFGFTVLVKQILSFIFRPLVSLFCTVLHLLYIFYDNCKTSWLSISYYFCLRQFQKNFTKLISAFKFCKDSQKFIRLGGFNKLRSLSTKTWIQGFESSVPQVFLFLHGET